jgi:hypothetical protein
MVATVYGMEHAILVILRKTTELVVVKIVGLGVPSPMKLL